MPDPSALSREICTAFRAAPSLDALASLWRARKVDRRAVIAANPSMQCGFSTVSRERAAELSGETERQGNPWEQEESA